MKTESKILIGGAALVKLGSSRTTSDRDYLINDINNDNMFIFDKENDIDYINANGHEFFNEIFGIEEGNEIATPESLLQLKAFAFVQHCKNFKFQKADDAEYDIKFLVRKFKVKNLNIVKKHIGFGEMSEIYKIINSVRV